MFKPELSVLCWLTPLLRSLELNLPSVCSMGGTFSVKLSSGCHPWLWMFCSCLRGFHGVPELSPMAWEGVAHLVLSVIVAGKEQSRVPGQKTTPIPSLKDGIVLPLRRKWNFHHKVAVLQVRFPHGHFLLPTWYQ